MNCFRKYRKPIVINNIVIKAVKLITLLYEYSMVGGHLHIVVDDWNIENWHITYCQKDIKNNRWGAAPEQLEVETVLCKIWLMMKIKERTSALYLYENMTKDQYEMIIKELKIRRR